MKFEKALKEKQEYAKSRKELLDIKNKKDSEHEEHVPTSSKSDVISDPDAYPKLFWPYDAGVSDRSPAGFTSDVNVLKQKELMGKKGKKK